MKMVGRGAAVASERFPFPLSCSNFNSNFWIINENPCIFAGLSGCLKSSSEMEQLPEDFQRRGKMSYKSTERAQTQKNILQHATYTFLAFRRYKCIFYVD